ncbi:hypothetical protein N431DRAFT_395155 [Stipitochalara longipes BDJ]|nr:hypothetical protein N431DRAFT_395155 [Stipitochalara longipes BDJ]
MFEIDHAAVNNPDPLPPEPAKPILASQLLELEQKQRRRFTKQGKEERISTGCGEIDEILGRGCERGIVVGISAEGGEGRLISLHLLVSVLLSNLDSSTRSLATPKATIIDTTGSFPVSLLAEVLKARVLSSRAATAIAAVKTANYTISGQEQEVGDEEVEKDVQRCLEMVAISRVFDIEGLWEALGEVARDDTFQDESYLFPSTRETDGQSPQKPTEILDSEEELTPDEASPIPPPSPNFTSGTEIIIIDNLTHIITELLARKEKSEGHSLLTLLSLTLHTLTHTSNILTILHNGTASSKPTSTSTANHIYPTTPSAPRNQHPRQPQIPNPSSIFLSNPMKPALGQIFTQFPELHLFISKLPKMRGDAEVLYGQDEDSFASYQKEVKYCFVVEVLKDETPNLGLQVENESGKGKEKAEEVEKGRGKKFGWREQRWTAVDVVADGTGFVGAFQVKGNMRGMGLEREKIGGLKDVGYIAKMYGFGGRRV